MSSMSKWLLELLVWFDFFLTHADFRFEKETWTFSYIERHVPMFSWLSFVWKNESSGALVPMAMHFPCVDSKLPAPQLIKIQIQKRTHIPRTMQPSQNIALFSRFFCYIEIVFNDSSIPSILSPLVVAWNYITHYPVLTLQKLTYQWNLNEDW